MVSEAKKRFLKIMVQLGKLTPEEYEIITEEVYE